MESGIYLRPFKAQVKQNWLVCHCQVMSARIWPVLFGRSRWCWCGGHRRCPCCRRQDSEEMPPLKSNCNQWRPGWFQRDGQGQVSKRKVSDCWQWGLSNAPESNGTANAMRLEEEVGQNGFRGAKTRSRRDAPEVTVATSSWRIALFNAQFRKSEKEEHPRWVVHPPTGTSMVEVTDGSADFQEWISRMGGH